jgi:soluble lytic murein transglycosylase-like protein
MAPMPNSDSVTRALGAGPVFFPRVRATILVLCALALLCQCATKHQPFEFAPYFPTRPATYFTTESLVEIARLEQKTELTRLEKKRLWDLYTLEIKQLKPGTPLAQQIAASAAALAPDAQPLDNELHDLQTEIARHREAPPADERAPVFTNVGFHREYSQIYQLWNKDQNDQALKRVSDLLKSPYKDKVSHAEWFKLLNLRFRIAIDLMDTRGAAAAYQAMKDFDSCHPDTAQAGLLIALSLFSGKDEHGALQTFESQCDPDKSPGNRIKRLYWEGRFQESNPTVANAKYEEVIRAKVPGYYFFLAMSRLGRKIEFAPTTFFTRSYLTRELEVSGEIDHLWSEAEERLKANLRRDASVYSMRASQLLKANPKPSDIPALLYTAHLLQASGTQLESMKIYAIVTSILQDSPTEETDANFDFLAEMFPRPHVPIVDWLAGQWDTDPDFIYAIMRQESAFNPGAVSLADARGLMQLMPFLARNIAQRWSYQTYYSDKLLFHARENLKLAVYHLHQLSRLAPHLALIAASYNAGLLRVGTWWKRNQSLPLDVFVELIPVSETRNYVKLVLRNYIHYRALRYGGVVKPDVVPFVLPAITPLAANVPRTSAVWALGSHDPGPYSKQSPAIAPAHSARGR